MDNKIVKQMIVVADPVFDRSRTAEGVALFQSDGTPITILVAEQTGADIVLTGMVAGADEAVAATDTVNEAIAKLQAQIDAINAA